MTPLQALKHHVTGAIERGEKQAIVEMTPRERQAWDADIQAAALRHYAKHCWDCAAGMRKRQPDDVTKKAILDFEARGIRADKLADTYERLAI